MKLGVQKGKFQAFCSDVQVLRLKLRVLRLKLEGLRLDDGDWKAIAQPK
ncbi:hypothetical protein [Nostoc sp.]